MTLLLPNQQRLDWAQRSIWLMVLVLGGDFLWQVYGFTLFQDLKSGAQIESSLSRFIAITHFWDWFRGAVLLTFSVLFIAWWHRMTVNYVRIGYPLSETPLMMLVWWFLWVVLPLFWWARPYSFVLEAAATPSNRIPTAVRPWWAWCMLGLVSSVLAYPVNHAARLANEYELAIVLRCVGDVALILSAHLLPAIITFIQRGQEGLAATLPAYTVPNIN